MTATIIPAPSLETQPPAPVEERTIYLENLTLQARIGMLSYILHDCLGKHINQICPHGFANPRDSHCAHFVSHVMGYSGRSTCKNQQLKTKDNREPGVLLRVDEIYNVLHHRGMFENNLPSNFNQGIIVVTIKTNVEGPNIKQHPLKHIGIWHANKVWHYSNGRNQVVMQTLGKFQKDFTASYYQRSNGKKVVYFYGGFLGSFL